MHQHHYDAFQERSLWGGVQFVVTNPETFTVAGGSVGTTAAQAAVVADTLLTAGFASTTALVAGKQVITVTNAGIAGGNGVFKISELCRIAKAAEAALTYTAAT